MRRIDEVSGGPSGTPSLASCSASDSFVDRSAHQELSRFEEGKIYGEGTRERFHHQPIRSHLKPEIAYAQASRVSRAGRGSTARAFIM